LTGLLLLLPWLLRATTLLLARLALTALLLLAGILLVWVIHNRSYSHISPRDPERLRYRRVVSKSLRPRLNITQGFPRIARIRFQP
jgi:hypothetical protein